LSSDVWSGWGSVLVVSIVVILVGAVVIVGAWQGIKSANVKAIARETVARDEAYRTLDAVQTKVDAIERMLREVG
jgi:Flp pilus assembly protein protease CpaA